MESGNHWLLLTFIDGVADDEAMMTSNFELCSTSETDIEKLANHLFWRMQSGSKEL